MCIRDRFFYLALDRLPLGTTVTIELLGPLTLSVVAGRRWMNLVWAGSALVGVVLLGGSATHLDPLGVAFTLVAAAFWAGYILSLIHILTRNEHSTNTSPRPESGYSTHFLRPSQARRPPGNRDNSARLESHLAYRACTP